MKSVNQTSNSNSVISGELPSHPIKKTLKGKLFVAQATPLNTLLSSMKKTFEHPIVMAAVTNSALGVSYFTYQYFFKSRTPHKVNVDLSLKEPVTMVMKALSPLLVIALGTKWFIYKSEV